MRNRHKLFQAGTICILKQVSNETYARFQEKMFLYPGFIHNTYASEYTKPVAAHILGYVSEVDEGVK